MRMLTESQVQPAGSEKMNRKAIPDQETTCDFVHFVVHFAATRSGERCDMCAGTTPVRYA